MKRCNNNNCIQHADALQYAITEIFILFARKPTKSTNEKAGIFLFFGALWKYVLYCNSLTANTIAICLVLILQDNLNTRSLYQQGLSLKQNTTLSCCT